MNERVGPEPEKGESRNWSVLDGEFNADTAKIDADEIKKIDQLVGSFKEEAAERVGLANIVNHALEVANPALPPEASTDIIKASKSVAARYNKSSLAVLKSLAWELDETPPPVVNVLASIFESSEDYKIGGLDLRAKAYGVIRMLYLMQSGRENELPQPLD